MRYECFFVVAGLIIISLSQKPSKKRVETRLPADQVLKRACGSWWKSPFGVGEQEGNDNFLRFSKHVKKFEYFPSFRFNVSNTEYLLIQPTTTLKEYIECNYDDDELVLCVDDLDEILEEGIHWGKFHSFIKIDESTPIDKVRYTRIALCQNGDGRTHPFLTFETAQEATNDAAAMLKQSDEKEESCVVETETSTPSVDFLIIGGAKCGTTSFQTLLRQHPGIYMPMVNVTEVKSRFGDVLGNRLENKTFDGVKGVKKREMEEEFGLEWGEMHFFDELYDLGPKWYTSYFTAGKVNGDKTPAYLCNEKVPLRVHKSFPETKLIALLRNPADRLYSHFRMVSRAGVERGVREWRLSNFLKFIAWSMGNGWRSYHSCLGIPRGFYANQLARWLEYFPREQLLVLRSEDYFVSSGLVFNETLRFLDVDVVDVTGFEKCASVKPFGEYPRMKTEHRVILDVVYGFHNDKLKHLVGWNWDSDSP